MSNLFIKKLSLRVSLSEADQEALREATSSTITVPSGRDLVTEGDFTDNAYIILEGFACRYKLVSNGGRSIVAYLVPGDGCDLHASILSTMVHSIMTLTECRVAVVPYRTIKQLAAFRPNVYLALWWTVLVDELILQEWLVGVGRRSADKQVAHFLCEVFARLQAVGLGFEAGYRLPLSQSELADTAGLSHVHVNRVLTDLRKAGLVEIKRKSLTVPNLDILKNFAEFTADYLHLPPVTSRELPPKQLSDATRREFEKRYS